MPQHFLAARRGRLFLWLGGAALAFLAFFRIARELVEGEVGSLDSAILHAVEKIRAPWLTAVAVDVTALGSITLVVLFSVFTLIVLLVLRDRWGALQLLAASAGAGLLTILTKDMIERVRPVEVQPLIVVAGYSFPSGHSLSTAALYLTITIIASRYIEHAGARATIFVAVCIVILVVAASRVYLGVHYATDVVSGISLGVSWALLLGGCFSLFARARRL